LCAQTLAKRLAKHAACLPRPPSHGLWGILCPGAYCAQACACTHRHSAVHQVLLCAKCCCAPSAAVHQVLSCCHEARRTPARGGRVHSGRVACARLHGPLQQLVRLPGSVQLHPLHALNDGVAPCAAAEGPKALFGLQRCESIGSGFQAETCQGPLPAVADALGALLWP